MAELKRFLTVSEVVEMGVASRTTVWRRIKAGELPAIKIGQRILIPREGLEEYLRSRYVVSDRALDEGLVEQARAQEERRLEELIDEAPHIDRRKYDRIAAILLETDGDE